MNIKKKELINEEILSFEEEGLFINLKFSQNKESRFLLINKDAVDELDKSFVHFFKDRKFSLIELIEKKKHFKNIRDFQLTYPEKFGQIALWNYIYYKWEMEVPNTIAGQRYDLYLKHKEKFISLIEVKNDKIFGTNRVEESSFVKVRDKAKEQLRDYIVKNRKSELDSAGNYFGLVFMDCNYLFNNPVLITYLSDALNGFYIPEINKNFMLQEIYLIKKNIQTGKTGLEEAEDMIPVKDGGIISFMEINKNDYIEIKNKIGISQIITSAMPSTLVELETDTNVRDISNPAVEIIQKNIEEDIKRKEENGDFYMARTSGTGDKHLSVKGEILKYDIKNSESIIVGLNIDEFNGQHSTTAYKIIEEKYKDKLKREQLLLPIKIFTYKTANEIFEIRQISNYSVGDTQIEKSKKIPLLKEINREMYNLDLKVQIIHPKKREINSTEKNIQIKYDEVFQYLTKFLYAHKKVFDNQKTNKEGLKIRDKQLKKSDSNNLESLFYDRVYTHKDYRTYNHKTGKYEEKNLKNLVKQEAGFIKAFAYDDSEELIYGKIEQKNGFDYFIYNSMEIALENTQLINAHQYLRMYEDALKIIENKQDFNIFNVKIFAYFLHEFCVAFYKNGRIINPSNTGQVGYYENEKFILLNDKTNIFFNVFYFSIKKFLSENKEIIKSKDEKIFKQIQSSQFKDIIDGYNKIFSFVNLLKDNNIEEFPVFNSPKKYDLDDESIDGLFDSNNKNLSAVPQKIIDRIKQGPSNDDEDKSFTFSSAKINVGEQVFLLEDKKVMATVYSDKKIMFKGEEMSLSGAAKKALQELGKDKKSYEGPALWVYKNENGEYEKLNKRRSRVENSKTI